MSDLVGNPEDRFSHNEAHFIAIDIALLSVCCTGAQKKFIGASSVEAGGSTAS